jgi:DNA primase
MARRKLSEKNIRSLNKTSGGRSYSVTIPLEFIQKLKWRGRQKLVVRLYGKKVIIEDWE